MVHSSMYQLQAELAQQIYDLRNQKHYHSFQATEVERKIEWKQKQLDELKGQIESVAKYEQEQRDKENL